MAKKMPKNKAQVTVNDAVAAPVEEITDYRTAEAKSKPQKTAVSVDARKAEPKKTKKTKKTSDKPNIFKRMWKGIKGIFSELKKVTWPKGKDVVKSTTVVLAVVFAFFIILFVIDYVLAGFLGLIVDGKWATIFI